MGKLDQRKEGEQCGHAASQNRGRDEGCNTIAPKIVMMHICIASTYIMPNQSRNT